VFRAMELLDKIRKVLRFLAECLLHELQWKDRMTSYSMIKRLITMAVISAEENDDNKAVIYVKRREKRVAGWYTR